MTEHKSNFPEFYITAPQPCPYLPGRLERKLFTHLTREKPGFLIDNLLKGGFRRSQNIAYMPYCDACSACVPVRILVDAFRPRRSLNRIARANRDVMTARMEPTPSAEQYSLFRAYIDARHGDGGMAEMSVLDYSLMVEDHVSAEAAMRLGRIVEAVHHRHAVAQAVAQRHGDQRRCAVGREAAVLQDVEQRLACAVRRRPDVVSLRRRDPPPPMPAGDDAHPLPSLVTPAIAGVQGDRRIGCPGCPLSRT